MAALAIAAPHGGVSQTVGTDELLLGWPIGPDRCTQPLGRDQLQLDRERGRRLSKLKSSDARA